MSETAGRASLTYESAGVAPTSDVLGGLLPWVRKSLALRTGIGATALDIGVADARALFGYLDQPVHTDGSRIVGFGRTREDAILATLRAADGAVERSAIEGQHGRGRLPPEIVFVDHGLVSVPEKIDGWERWLRRLPPIARRH